MTPRLLLLTISILAACGCGRDSGAGADAGDADGALPPPDGGPPPPDGGLPLSDGGSLPVPAVCQVATTAAPPYQVTIRFRNTGQRTVFFPNTYSCSVAATISSCAADHDDFLNDGTRLCPCSGTCPVGGPGCPAAGIAVDPGQKQELTWQAGITIVGTLSGAACSLRWEYLPAGRYRVTAKLFATAEHAVAGTPILRDLEKDFVLPSVDGLVDVPFSVD